MDNCYFYELGAETETNVWNGSLTMSFKRARMTLIPLLDKVCNNSNKIFCLGGLRGGLRVGQLGLGLTDPLGLFWVALSNPNIALFAWISQVKR